MKCLICETNEPWSRGLCSGCYSSVSRAGLLNDYPTNSFMRDMETHTRWVFGYVNFEDLQDIAVEFGYRITKTP